MADEPEPPEKGRLQRAADERAERARQQREREPAESPPRERRSDVMEALARRQAQRRVEEEALLEADEKIVDEFIELLADKWGERKCPYCEAFEWKISTSLLGVPLLRGEGVQPFFLVTCGNCGASVLVPTEHYNLWPEPEPEPGSA